MARGPKKLKSGDWTVVSGYDMTMRFSESVGGLDVKSKRDCRVMFFNIIGAGLVLFSVPSRLKWNLLAAAT